MQSKVISIDRQTAKRSTYLIKSKFRLCLFITLLLLIFISLFSPLWLKGNAMEEPVDIVSIDVKSGDTLWAIAKDSLPRHRDIRDYIIEIKEINQLNNANILIDQQLLIPVYQTN